MTTTHEYTPGVKLNTDLNRYVNLKLAALGQPPSVVTAEPEFMALAAPLVRNHFEKDQLFGWPLCPADERIQTFLDSYLSDVCPEGVARLPRRHPFVGRTHGEEVAVARGLRQELLPRRRLSRGPQNQNRIPATSRVSSTVSPSARVKSAVSPKRRS